MTNPAYEGYENFTYGELLLELSGMSDKELTADVTIFLDDGKGSVGIVNAKDFFKKNPWVEHPGLIVDYSEI